MAVTITSVAAAHYETYTITITADGSATVTLPDKLIERMSITSEGTDGGGTLTWFAGDGTTFSALGVALIATPDTKTVVSATAAGVWNVPADSLGHRAVKFTLASSTNPVLVLTLNITF